ncbi:MAG: TIR domain-containing protein [Oscillospiraceae bacterium]|jgi:GTPase SAR1 family protein|nr:TIR domain-containing protein [Oscillospiraceae bacterium]
MSKIRCFVSCDYRNDESRKALLAELSRRTDSPFEVCDYSTNENVPNWEQNVRERIRHSGVVIVLCGRHTDTAPGVTEEVKIAQEEGVDYFFLNAYGDADDVKEPISAKLSDRIHAWSWDNLVKMIHGDRQE